ncbi:MAG TPA: GNAT family N-acetyltransferase [Terriglobia bacterium]|jgi:ribosomal protein S18 acetylase RimI-like enzyme
MQNFTIRLANASDLPTLGRLGAVLVKTHFDFDRQRFKAPMSGLEEGYAWFLGHRMKEPGAVVFVAERDQAILGYVYAEMEPESWKELRDEAGFIHDVVVDASCRHGGIGAALIETASEWLREQGAPRVILSTAEQNTGAQRLFSRLGFRRTMIEMTREFPGKG